MTGPTIGEMIADITRLNIDKGWRDADGGPGTATYGDYIALLNTEIAEATEAYRSYRLNDATEPHYKHGIAADPRPPKPEGVGAELADVLIRLLDTAAAFNIDLNYISDHTLAGFDPYVPASVYPPVVSFGDHMAWLHTLVTDLWCSNRRHTMAVNLLTALVTVAEMYGLDLAAEYERKMTYNRTRPYQHGGRTIADNPQE